MVDECQVKDTKQGENEEMQKKKRCSLAEYKQGDKTAFQRLSECRARRWTNVQASKESGGGVLRERVVGSVQISPPLHSEKRGTRDAGLR